MREAHQAAVGTLIASLRQRQGWSQRALARWVGIDQSAVSRIEAGRRRISAEELQRFADALHVSADDLLKGAPRARIADPATTSGADAGPWLHQPRSGDEIMLAPSPDPSLLDLRSPVMRVRRDPGDTDARDASAAPPAVAHLGRMHPRALPPEQADVGPALDRERERDGALDSRPARSFIAGGGAPSGRARLAGLPDEVAVVTRDWFTVRALAGPHAHAQQRWSTGHSAEGKPERVAHTGGAPQGSPAADVLYDRVARFWRSELHVDPDHGPLPDLVPLLEDGYGAQVIVARVAAAGLAAPGAAAAGRDRRTAAETPVAASFAVAGIPFIFVNAARPVALQRFALAHAFAHLVLGHGDVVDRRIEWGRNVPPEAAANDFAEELLAPVRAVQRWYERRAAPHGTGVDDLLLLGNAFGISAWAALYRSRAAGRLQGKRFHRLKAELRRREWDLLPRQAFLGGLRDTLTHLTPHEALPAGEYGGPAVLRVPAAMRLWSLAAVRDGRLSLEGAAAMLGLAPGDLALQLARLGVE